MPDGDNARPQLADPREDLSVASRPPALGDDEAPLMLATTDLIPMAAMPLALQIFFDDRLFQRCKMIATYMARAEGFVPRHLVGKLEGCFAVVSRSLTWKLDPYAVAQATYQTPDGKVGYYGALCQAIIENSGRLVGGVRFAHFGDWAKVARKFKFETSAKGHKYPVQGWADKDEEGVGVTVSAQLKDEAEPRTLEFFLAQAHPRNSTLWATDPMTQIKYTAVRRFATSVAPSLFMGVPFDREEVDDWVSNLKDVTPRAPVPLQEVPAGRTRRKAETEPKPAQDAQTSAAGDQVTDAVSSETEAGQEQTGDVSDQQGTTTEQQQVAQDEGAPPTAGETFDTRQQSDAAPQQTQNAPQQQRTRGRLFEE